MTQVKRKYELYSDEMYSDPYPTYDVMRRDDPVMGQVGIDGETTIYFLTRYHDVERVLTGEGAYSRDMRGRGFDDTFPDPDIDNLLNNHMLNKDGADHRRLRSLVSQAFTPKRVRDMRPRVQAIADGLLDPLIDRGAMDLIGDYAFHLPTIVILEMLGVPADDRAQFRAWSNAVLSPALDEASQAKAIAQMSAFLAYVKALLAERRAQPTGDMISALVHAEEAGDRLSEGELLGMMMLLIVAGHETTVNLIGNAMVALWRNPATLARLRAEPELMPTAVEEFLRYDGPVERAFNRIAVRSDSFDGGVLPDNALVIPILGAADRDPAVFADPHRLDITRTPNPHLAFGKGPHYCLGAPLARMEGEIALNTLLRRLPGMRPAVPLDALRYRPLPGFRALEALPVEW